MVLKNKGKHQDKLQLSSNLDMGEDKISNLPDALIHHIFSFLPTKCSMSTCILSQRWKYLSNSNPTLQFLEWLPHSNYTAEEIQLKTQQFMNFMDTVLYVHEKPNIQKFSLSWDQLFDESRVNKWIGTVIKRKVRELSLSGSGTSQRKLVFPLSFFTCDSLTVLDLENVTFNVPNTVSFRSLKLLRLTRMDVENWGAGRRLISNCPMLEELYFTQCRGLMPEILCSGNVALKNLHIVDFFLSNTTVEIGAPNLSTISSGQKEPDDFVINSFPSLIEADIDAYLGATASALIKLLEKVSNVKLLKMTGACFLAISEADILLLPAFNNLIHLKVTSELRFYGSYTVSVARRFFKLLQLLPNLESIVFAQGIHIPDEEGDATCWSLDPKCSLPYLKSIQFKDFGGEPMELNAIKLFLKHARFLETVTIVAIGELSNDYEEQTKIMKLLLMCPKPANCVVKFLTSSKDGLF